VCIVLFVVLQDLRRQHDLRQQQLDVVQQHLSKHNSELKAQQQRLAALNRSQALAEAAAGRQLHSLADQLQAVEEELRAAGCR